MARGNWCHFPVPPTLSPLCSPDIDECTEGSHSCRYNQICQNAAGSYHCSCPPGYRTLGVGWPCLGTSWALRVTPCPVPASVSPIQLQLPTSFLPQMSTSACSFPRRVPLSAATCGAPTSACAPLARACCRAGSAARQGWREGTQGAAWPGTLPCAGRGRAAAPGDDPSTLSSPCAAWPRMRGRGPAARPAPRATSGGMAPALVSVHWGRLLKAVQGQFCPQKGPRVLLAAVSTALFAPCVLCCAGKGR